MTSTTMFRMASLRARGSFMPTKQSNTSKLSFSTSPQARPKVRFCRRDIRFSNSTGRRLYSTYDSFSYGQSTKRAAIFLIGLNTAVFGTWAYLTTGKDGRLKNEFFQNMLLSWQNIRAGRYQTLITSAFTHLNLGHFFFNMFALWTFSSIISFIPGVGGLHLLAVSMGSALTGSLAWLYQQQSNDQGGRQRLISANGASGMVFGIGAVASCLMPYAPLYLMFIPIPIPLYVVFLGYGAFDIYYLDANDRVGHSAHLGGAACGVGYYLAFLRGRGGVWYMARRLLGRR